MRRLDVSAAVEQEFGAIGVTQETIDIFARRLQEAENSSFFDFDTGTRKAGSIAVRDGHLILSELTEDEINKKIDLMRGDLEWLKSECELVPAVARVDPDDAIIRFRREEGGGFFDDIFASDGSGRIRISDDFQLRQWAEGLFKNKDPIQALLFHLEEVNKLPIQVVVKSTVHLCELGEEALSTNTERVLAAAEMLASGELSDGEFALFCSLLGAVGCGHAIPHRGGCGCDYRFVECGFPENSPPKGNQCNPAELDPASRRERTVGARYRTNLGTNQ